MFDDLDTMERADAVLTDLIGEAWFIADGDLS